MKPLLTLLSLTLTPSLLATASAANTAHSHAPSALDAAIQDLPATTAATTPAATSATSGFDISLSTLMAAGCSDATSAELEQLQAGGHDPKKCGFNLQAAELSLIGNVDPFTRLVSHIVFMPGHVELEEAYASTTALPAALELKGGYFLTEFGKRNAQHGHSSDWLDQPIIAGRLLGEDGLRGAGVRLSWLMPTRYYSQLSFGIQNADDDSMVSFRGTGHQHGEDSGHGHQHDSEHEHAHDEHEESEGEAAQDLSFDGPGGSLQTEYRIRNPQDLLYLLRWHQGWDFGAEHSVQWGLSGLLGPNASGRHSKTRIYGTDFEYRWQPSHNFRGAPYLSWQTEWMQRRFEVEAFDDEHQGYGNSELIDQGYFSQIKYQFRPDWSLGLRFETAQGKQELAGHARQQDWQRSDRSRWSPVLSYRPSHFSRIRLQYNHDRSDQLADDKHRANTLWLGFDFVLGSHPAHDW